MTQASVNITQAGVNITPPLRKKQSGVKAKPITNTLKYYQTLDYVSKILFKREVLTQLDWSPKTFHNRMKSGVFHPGERIMINKIIFKEEYLIPTF